MRMKAVMGRILSRSPSTELIVMGSMPDWVFSEAPSLNVRFRHLVCDVGAVQRDSIHLDVGETLRRNRLFYRAMGDLVRKEAEFVGREGIDLIVGDIPPIAFLVSAAAGIKSIAVGNFSWDWIYEDYAARAPRIAPLVALIREAYGKASLLLRLPFHGDMSAFGNVRDIPLVTRMASTPAREVRRRLGIGRGEGRKVVFVSLGGHDNERLLSGARADMGNYVFISYFPLPAREGRVIVLRDRASFSHPDIVRASDAVVSKPGYCTVAECIANRTPLLYTERDDFREYAVLEEAIRRHLPSGRIPKSDFLSGRWKQYLDSLFRCGPRWCAPPLELDGADRAAAIILERAGAPPGRRIRG